LVTTLPEKAYITLHVAPEKIAFVEGIRIMIDVQMVLLF
jgi:hypothetical protein